MIETLSLNIDFFFHCACIIELIDKTSFLRAEHYLRIVLEYKLYTICIQLLGSVFMNVLAIMRDTFHKNMMHGTIIENAFFYEAVKREKKYFNICIMFDFHINELSHYLNVIYVSNSNVYFCM